MQHRLCAGLAQVGKARVETDGGKRCNHQELADALERSGETRGDDADAAQNGHCKKAKDEPGENGLHIDLDAMVAALRGGLLL